MHPVHAVVVVSASPHDHPAAVGADGGAAAGRVRAARHGVGRRLKRASLLAVDIGLVVAKEGEVIVYLNSAWHGLPLEPSDGRAGPGVKTPFW